MARKTFNQTLDDALDDMLSHGFDNEERLSMWEARLRESAEAFGEKVSINEDLLRRTLVRHYRKLVDDGEIEMFHPGMEPGRIKRIKPSLQAELDRRMLAARNLIKLDRRRAVDQTIQRFSGWATSVPKGGTKAQAKGKLDEKFGKALRSLNYEQRRMLIDQGHKFTAALNDIVSKDGGAIAGRWHSNWRQPGYDYREDHKERDRNVYLIRGSWAHKAGYVKAGPSMFCDQQTMPAEEPYCRCRYIYLYNLRDIPGAMITKKGAGALSEAADRIRQMTRADSEVKSSKEQASYTLTPPGPFHCRECTMFRYPDACTAVEGFINGGAWCRYFEPEVALLETVDV